MDKNDKPDNTELTLPAEPTEKAEATEPAEPMDKIDPAEPMDRMDPLDPMDRIEPGDPASSESRLVCMIAFSQHSQASRWTGSGEFPPGAPGSSATPRRAPGSSLRAARQALPLDSRGRADNRHGPAPGRRRR